MSKEIQEALAKDETPVISLDDTANNVSVSGKDLLSAAGSGKEIEIVKRSIQAAINHQAVNSLGVNDYSKLDITVTENEKTLNEKTTEALERMASVNSELSKTVYTIGLTHNGQTVSSADQLFIVSIDISEKNLTEDQLSSLTGVYYEPADGMYKQLGGEVSNDGKTFVFHTPYSGDYGIVVSDSLISIKFKIGNIEYNVNRSAITNDVAPFIRENRIMLPLRTIAEALDAEVGWDEATKTVSVTSGGKSVSVVIGEPLPNGMGTSEIMDNRTFVPIRYIAQELGANVVWDDKDRTVSIYK